MIKPFFILYFCSPFQIGSAFARYGSRDISWATHGMMKIEVRVMKKLFERPLQRIIEVGSELLSDQPL